MIIDKEQKEKIDAYICRQKVYSGFNYLKDMKLPVKVSLHNILKSLSDCIIVYGGEEQKRVTVPSDQIWVIMNAEKVSGSKNDAMVLVREGGVKDRFKMSISAMQEQVPEHEIELRVFGPMKELSILAKPLSEINSDANFIFYLNVIIYAKFDRMPERIPIPTQPDKQLTPPIKEPTMITSDETSSPKILPKLVAETHGPKIVKKGKVVDGSELAIKLLKSNQAESEVERLETEQEISALEKARSELCKDIKVLKEAKKGFVHAIKIAEGKPVGREEKAEMIEILELAKEAMETRIKERTGTKSHA